MVYLLACAAVLGVVGEQDRSGVIDWIDRVDSNQAVLGVPRCREIIASLGNRCTNLAGRGQHGEGKKGVYGVANQKDAL